MSVIGGNRDFTGAPYFSAFSAMQAGADYGNVCCTADAATVIKSYAPELIVIPCMLQVRDLVSSWVRFFPNSVWAAAGPAAATRLGANPQCAVPLRATLAF